MTNLKTFTLSLALGIAFSGCAQQPAAASAYPDFTQAAESTINGVVSIKSYATPRVQQYAPQGGYDPFLDFFLALRSAVSPSNSLSNVSSSSASVRE